MDSPTAKYAMRPMRRVAVVCRRQFTSSFQLRGRDAVNMTFFFRKERLPQVLHPWVLFREAIYSSAFALPNFRRHQAKTSIGGPVHRHHLPALWFQFLCQWLLYSWGSTAILLPLSVLYAHTRIRGK